MYSCSKELWIVDLISHRVEQSYTFLNSTVIFPTIQWIKKIEQSPFSEPSFSADSVDSTICGCFPTLRGPQDMTRSDFQVVSAISRSTQEVFYGAGRPVTQLTVTSGCVLVVFQRDGEAHGVPVQTLEI